VVVVVAVAAGGTQDHMRRVGDVCHAQVNRDGTGEVEFGSYEDMKYAVCVCVCVCVCCSWIN
jgi:hypothetical protein